MKIAIGQVTHETNTFSTTETTIESFKRWELCYGNEIIQRHRGVSDYLGGMIDACEKLDIEIAPAFSAFTYPSGVVTAETYHFLENELIKSIEGVGEVDAICLALHGAGVSESTDDLEGTLLKALRNKIGYEIPIVVTLDLHANITPLMVDEADLLLGVHYYPHTDSVDRGKEAVELAVKLCKKELNPSKALINLPLIIPTSTTNQSPAKDINNICWKFEEEDSVIDCTFFHGFPYTDIKHIGVSVLVYTDNNQQLAERIAEDVASNIWDSREEFTSEALSPREGIEKALSMEGGPVVINETSDNPGGGTPGDGTYLLRELLDNNLKNTCFGMICDPEVTQIAHESGVGSYITVPLGGKTDNLHGGALNIKGYVKSLTDGIFFHSTPMWKGLKTDLGKSVRLQIGNVDVIVCSEKSQVMDEQIFLLHGIDVSKYKIVALKSSQHFRAAFEPISKAIITVDSPGLTTLDFTTFDYKQIRRPIYPLDSFKENINPLKRVF